jgi:hypothetical protein
MTKIIGSLILAQVYPVQAIQNAGNNQTTMGNGGNLSAAGIGEIQVTV